MKYFTQKKLIKNILSQISRFNKFPERRANLAFYLFIFLLPWQTVLLLRETFVQGEKFQYATIGIYFFEIILIAYLIATSLFAIKKNKSKTTSRKKTFLNIFILLFVIWSFFSTAWSSDKYLSLIFSSHITLGALLFWTIQFLQKINLNQVFKVLLISSFFQSLLALFQFFSQSSFSNKYLGISAQDSWQGGAHVLENVLGRWLRASGGMPHPNMMGGFLTVSLLLGIAYYLSLKKDALFWKRTSLVLLSVNFLALLTTFSRSAFLSFLIAFSFVLFFLWQKRATLLLKKISSLCFVFIAIFSIFTLSYSELIIGRASHQSRLENQSFDERSLYLAEAGNIIKNHSLLGVGTGNYTHYLRENSLTQKPPWEIQPVHNIFLLIFSELGIVGVFLFLGILFFEFIYKKNPFRELSTDKLFVFSALLALFIISFFDHWTWSSVSGLLLFWLLLGLYTKQVDTR